MEKERAARRKKLEKEREKKKKARNKEFTIVTCIFVCVFISMMGYIAYFQIYRSPGVLKSAYNTRMDSASTYVTKGSITDDEGNILAETETDSEGNETRTYPYANMFAHVVGFDVNGKYGLESIESADLLTSSESIVDKVIDGFEDDKYQGDTVRTTLNMTLQSAAYNALGDNRGAVVVMEPQTGAILALVSKPDFDPNSIDEDWDSISEDDDGALVNRAVMGQYAPGSTFKIVTALEYIRENSDYDSYSYYCNGSITAGDNTIQCYNGTVHGEVDLEQSFAYSCNTSFCNIGSTLDISSFRDTAEKLLFNSELPCMFSYNKSSFTLSEDSGEASRMMTAMGQGETEVSPYHMALITSAVANDGVLMTPYIVDEIISPDGDTVSTTKQKKYERLMSEDEAAILKGYMESVVSYGTGTVLSGQSYTAAGKTGTAEYSDDTEQDHSWFVGMTNVDDPELVISVIVEKSDGNTKAVNVAKEIFDAYYQ